MRQTFTIVVPVYRTYLDIYVDAENGQELHNHLMLKRGEGKSSIDGIDAMTYGLYLDHDNKRRCAIAFYTLPITAGTIAHEVFHAASFILDSVGVWLDDASEEAYATLIDYITDSIYGLDIKQEE